MCCLTPLLRRLSALEGAVLCAALYFFWFPSNFPADAPGRSGIETAEWQWVALLVAAWLPLSWLWASRRWRLLMAGLIALGLLLHVSGLLQDASDAIDRQDWFWLALPLLPPAAWRVFGHLRRRDGPLLAFDALFAAFIALCLLSVTQAPVPSRGVGMVMRPLLGYLLALKLIAWGQRSGDPRGPLGFLIGLGLLLAVIALTGTQWALDKADPLRGLIDRLPDAAWLPLLGTANPNEIGGLLAWMIPIMAGAALLPWRWPPRMALAALTLVLLLGLIVGQSRAAIIGVLTGLALLALLPDPRPEGRTLRRLLLVGVALLALFQASLTFNLLPAGSTPDDAPVAQGTPDAPTDAAGLSDRDRQTTAARTAYWAVAGRIISDHPLTGVGMNRFRYVVYVEPRYAVQSDTNPYPPHTHNEVLQIATDLGLPGLFVFVGWHGVALWWLWRAWQHRDPWPHGAWRRGIAAALAAGLLAHAIYGLADAVPIWDRGAFLFWAILGVLGAAGAQQRGDLVSG